MALRADVGTRQFRKGGVLEMLENDWETTKELEDDRCQEGEEINI